MAKALYHQQGKAPLSLDILKKNADGTCDLGRDGTVVVASCPVGDTAGFCTPETEEKKKRKGTGAPVGGEGEAGDETGKGETGEGEGADAA